MKYVSRVLGVLALALGLAAPAGAQNQPLEKLVVNQAAQSMASSAVYVAYHSGFFKEVGLDVEIVSTGSGIKAIAPLINGASKFCICVFTHALNAANADAGDVKVISSLVTGYGHMIVIQPELAKELNLDMKMPWQERLKLLKGLKVGVTELGGGGDQAIRLLLDVVGMDPSRDLELIALGATDNLPPALQQKQIDAFILTPPYPQRSIQAGDAVPLYDPAVDKAPLLSEATFIAIVADSSFLADNEDLAVKFLKVVARGQKFVQENTAEARKILKEKEFAKMDQATFDVSFDAAFPLYTKTPVIARENVQAAFDLANRFAKEPLKVSVDELLAPEPAAKAIAD